MEHYYTGKIIKTHSLNPRVSHKVILINCISADSQTMHCLYGSGRSLMDKCFQKAQRITKITRKSCSRQRMVNATSKRLQTLFVPRNNSQRKTIAGRQNEEIKYLRSKEMPPYK
ncbi:hypothetical protein CEXT_319551 [Caerostris extrusa]|uniref:Uncharacterized protein n=1 Tax=Caerostris extrusa TaxID=172846 RepID=A0AAV4M6F8_CAEEX|nr:hypothetical protein CEXT_319551 [Caerostris extrusa]